MCIFKDSQIKVDPNRLREAESGSSACVFVKKLLTAAGNVVDFYRVSSSGQERSTSQTKKVILNPIIRSELVRAAKARYIEKDGNQSRSSFTRAIGNKLSALNDLFDAIKKGEHYDLKKFKELSDFDLNSFSGFDEYVKDPSKFSDLDHKIDNLADALDVYKENDSTVVDDLN